MVLDPVPRTDKKPQGFCAECLLHAWGIMDPEVFRGAYDGENQCNTTFVQRWFVPEK